MSVIELPDVLRGGDVEVVFDDGALTRIGELARREGAQRVLLVTDPGLRAAGHVEHAAVSLADAGIRATVFDGARENPTTRQVEQGLAVARAQEIDFIVGLGGGSAMDCAKGINLLCTNGGAIADYWGVNKPTAPMLPSILIPTTAGTGSEAQSFALIADETTHAKMACGDRRLPRAGGLRPRFAILDPRLTATAPRETAVVTALDALSHAVETAGSNARNERSREFSRLAWKLLTTYVHHVVAGNPIAADSDANKARAGMLIGAHLAGLAIEHSMLGAAHACANPLTARFGITHGIAVSLMLPHVVRFNASNGEDPYADLGGAPAVAECIDSLLAIAERPRTLGMLNVPRGDLPELAELAAGQWTAGFNPRPVNAHDLLEIYRHAF